MRPLFLVRALRLGLAVVGCAQESPAPRPQPAEVNDEATGHYCGMLLVEHEGPKGQIHLTSRSEPLWFSSVRDTIAFTRLPGEPRDITAIYVNDMARATNWKQPEPGAWIDANEAWFVIESKMSGGMGAPEAAPFSGERAAEMFRTEHGGRVVRLAEIPDSYVVGPVDSATESPPTSH